MKEYVETKKVAFKTEDSNILDDLGFSLKR